MIWEQAFPFYFTLRPRFIQPESLNPGAPQKRGFVLGLSVSLGASGGLAHRGHQIGIDECPEYLELLFNAFIMHLSTYGHQPDPINTEMQAQGWEAQGIVTFLLTLLKGTTSTDTVTRGQGYWAQIQQGKEGTRVNQKPLPMGDASRSLTPT